MPPIPVTTKMRELFFPIMAVGHKNWFHILWMLHSAIKMIFQCSKFDEFLVDFDFALMRLAEPLDFHERDNVRPICLPRESVANPEIGAKVKKT